MEEEEKKELKDTMIKMTRTDKYEYNNMTFTHVIGVNGKHRFNVDVKNGAAYNQFMQEEEARALYSILHNLFGKDDTNA